LREFFNRNKKKLFKQEYIQHKFYKIVVYRTQ